MISLDQFKYKAIHKVTLVRDGDTDESYEVVDPKKIKRVSRYPAGNSPETGVPYAAEAKGMLEKFVAANDGYVLKVALDKGGSLSGDRNRWHTLCQDFVTGEWFNPLVPAARKGYIVPFANRDEPTFNGPVMVAAQQAMADQIGMWSHRLPDLRVVAEFNPTGSDEGNEHVDVFNDSETDFSLENHSVRSDGAWGEKQRGYPFPKGAHILPKGRVRVWVGRKGINTHDEFFWGNLPDAPLATFKNLDEEKKVGGMAILMSPLPDMVPLAWHCWPNRL